MDQCSDPKTEDALMSSPDDTVHELLAPSPTEGLKLYSEQIIHMTKVLEYLSMEPYSSELIMKVLYNPKSGPMALPLLQGV